jgi:hypothetical protein
MPPSVTPKILPTALKLLTNKVLAEVDIMFEPMIKLLSWDTVEFLPAKTPLRGSSNMFKVALTNDILFTI